MKRRLLSTAFFCWASAGAAAQDLAADDGAAAPPPLSHTLLYATAGAAFGNFQTTHNFVVSGNTDQPYYSTVGWTLGAGVEYAFMGDCSPPPPPLVAKY